MVRSWWLCSVHYRYISPFTPVRFLMRAIFFSFFNFSYGFMVKKLPKCISGYAVSGAEAMFADLGHFSVRAIQVGQCIPFLSLEIASYILFIEEHHIIYTSCAGCLQFCGVPLPSLSLHGPSCLSDETPGFLG